MSHELCICCICVSHELWQSSHELCIYRLHACDSRTKYVYVIDLRQYRTQVTNYVSTDCMCVTHERNMYVYI